jgi:hypothetical protein
LISEVGRIPVRRLSRRLPSLFRPVENALLENERVCLAAASGAEIEFVKDSEALAKKGALGCCSKVGWIIPEGGLY